MIIIYKNENDFKKCERGIKKFSMISYKALMFDIYPKLRKGEFVGEIVSKNNNSVSYSLNLPTDDVFFKVYGEVKLNYTVDYDDEVVCLDMLEPYDALLDGHMPKMPYRGVMASKGENNSLFKINLMDRLNK